MDIDEYFEKLGHLAEIAKEAEVAVHRLVENPGGGPTHIRDGLAVAQTASDPDVLMARRAAEKS